MVNVDVVATGSSGNFCVINEAVAIDAGVPYKAVQPYMDKIRLLLLTYVHS